MNTVIGLILFVLFTALCHLVFLDLLWNETSDHPKQPETAREQLSRPASVVMYLRHLARAWRAGHSSE